MFTQPDDRPGYTIVAASFADDRTTIISLWDSGLAPQGDQAALMLALRAILSEETTTHWCDCDTYRKCRE
jgi:hypothetical protein